MSPSPSGSRRAAASDVTAVIVAVINSLLSLLKWGRATSCKKARNRPALPDDSVIELLLFMDRDALDSMQLVCRFVRDFIEKLDRRSAQLALRWIDKVDIAKVVRGRRKRYQKTGPDVWKPIVALLRDKGRLHEKVAFHYTDSLGPYLRHAYCDAVRIDLQLLSHSCSKRPDDVYRRIFEDLDAEETPVNILCVSTCRLAPDTITRSLQAFKAVKVLHHEWIPRCAQDLDVSEAAFDEDFFLHAASRGVRDFLSLEWLTHVRPDDGCVETRTSAALAFGFAEPESGGNRELTMDDYCEFKGNFLAQLCQKTSELDGSRHIDFKFMLTLQHTVSLLYANEFEKYCKDDLMWRIDDFKNGVTLEIKEVETEDDLWKIDIKVSSPP